MLQILLVPGKRALLRHNRHNLIKRIGSSHSRQLSISIIRGRDFDDIRRDEVQALEATDDGADLARAPAARFGGARRGREGRVDGVDVDGEVDRVGGADAVADRFDDARGADRVDFARFDDLEAAVAVVFVVGEAGQGCADAGVDVGVVGEEAWYQLS